MLYFSICRDYFWWEESWGIVRVNDKRRTIQTTKMAQPFLISFEHAEWHSRNILRKHAKVSSNYIWVASQSTGFRCCWSVLNFQKILQIKLSITSIQFLCYSTLTTLKDKMYKYKRLD